MAEVILKCLAKDQIKRYQGAEDLTADLTSISQGLPRVERGATRREPITSKKILLPAVALVFLAGAFILWRTVFYQAKGPEGLGLVEPPGPGNSQKPAAFAPGPGQEGPGPISRLTAEVQKYLKIKEIGELSDPEKFMEALRGVLPQESTALETLKDKNFLFPWRVEFPFPALNLPAFSCRNYIVGGRRCQQPRKSGPKEPAGPKTLPHRPKNHRLPLPVIMKS